MTGPTETGPDPSAGRRPRRERPGISSRLSESRLLPALLLLLSLGAVFAFGHLRGGFFRSPATDRITFDNLAVVENLFSGRSFARFYRLTLDESGEVVPEMHNRFPPGGHLLIGLVVAAFDEGGLAADLRAARVLMLLFFAGAAGGAYLSLRRLTGHRWIALTATLLTFSSWYCWRHADLVATDGSPDLFGFVLTFHGVVVFVQDGRFRQLLVKTGIALLSAGTRSPCWRPSPCSG